MYYFCGETHSAGGPILITADISLTLEEILFFGLIDFYFHFGFPETLSTSLIWVFPEWLSLNSLNSVNQRKSKSGMVTRDTRCLITDIFSETGFLRLDLVRYLFSEVNGKRQLTRCTGMEMCFLLLPLVMHWCCQLGNTPSDNTIIGILSQFTEFRWIQ